MPNGTDILITGGYGTVGGRVAADLAPDYPDRVVVAGRSAEKATRLAGELGHGARARRVDVGDPDSVEAALGGVGLVVSCIDQPEPHLLRAAIARGLAYTDIAPHLMTRRPTEAMKAEATRTGARIVLGSGLAPGISSLLARLGADRVGVVESVESNVLLSVGDAYGPASRAYLLEEISLSYAVRFKGRETSARSFGGHARVTFPPPFGRRTAYLFPFSDQVFFPETLGARTALSRLALEPPWLGALLSALVRLRVTAMLGRRAGAKERVQRLNAWLRRRHEGHDWYGVAVEVEGARGRVRASLLGRGQATGTAVGAAAVVRALARDEVRQAGIWLAEEVVAPGSFFEHLAARGLVPTVEEIPEGKRTVRHSKG
ncbi:MAG TPA: saccharopine dehydrogenase NADP-binding domain-containing protein [Rubrobacter sp.]|nr:saccharopine dehydrogenase NADP-binding domain-containing protein [Rubrobacter sp.]